MAKIDQKGDYSKLTVPEIQVLLKNVGLRVSGAKPDLVKRLEGYDGSAAK